MTELNRMFRAAEVRASSYDEGDNSIEVVWTTGAAVRRRDWRTGNFYSEILEVTPKAVRLDRLNSGAPLVDTHDTDSLRSVIGSVVPGSAKIEGGKGMARVRLSNAPGDADIVSKIRDGIIRNISVGYAIHRVEKTEMADSDDEWRVVDWEPYELSGCAVGADAGSQIRSDGATNHPDLNVTDIIARAAVSLNFGSGLANALDLGRAAASEKDDPEDAALAAWEENEGLDEDERGAAAAAAFIFAAAGLVELGSRSGRAMDKDDGRLPMFRPR